jgi:hypothetical protein
VTIPNVNLGAWTAFTPTFTGLTVGNGTLVNCRYAQIGKTIVASLGLTWGSTTSITSVVDFALPVTAKALTGNPNLGLARYADSGAGQYNGVAVYISSTTARLQRSFISGSEVLSGELAAVSPFTWTTNDQMNCIITYEAA